MKDCGKIGKIPDKKLLWYGGIIVAYSFRNSSLWYSFKNNSLWYEKGGEGLFPSNTEEVMSSIGEWRWDGGLLRSPFIEWRWYGGLVRSPFIEWMWYEGLVSSPFVEW